MADLVILKQGYNVFNGFQLDCTLKETHTFENEVTDFPVEGGSTISDNIRRKPIEIMLECVVSNTPIGVIALQGNHRPEAHPVEWLFDYFEQMMERRETVFIITSLRTYATMAIESITVPRDAKSGKAMFFTMRLKQIKFVANERRKRVAVPNCGGNRNTGSKGLLTTNLIDIDGPNGRRNVYQIALPNGAIGPLVTYDPVTKKATVVDKDKLGRMRRDPHAYDVYYDERGMPHVREAYSKDETDASINKKHPPWWDKQPIMPAVHNERTLREVGSKDPVPEGPGTYRPNNPSRRIREI